MTKSETLGGSSLLIAGAGLAALVWYSQQKASAPITVQGVRGLVRLKGGSPAVLRGVMASLGQDMPIDSTIDPSLTVTPDLPTFDAPPLPDPSFSDIGTGAPSIMTALPNGDVLDMTGAVDQTDPTSGQTFQVAADGTKLFADGTAILPDGNIMLPSGTEVAPDGSMLLTNGESVPASTPMPDGSGTSSETIAKLVGQGLTVAAATLTTLQKFGIAVPPPRSPGMAASSGWVSGSQYRTASGQIVTPSKLNNGLYQLPDGTTVGAPSSTGLFGLSSSTMLMVGAGVLAVMFLRRR